MSSNLYLRTIAIGLAMFSMFFGAGNIIFPLAIGQYAQGEPTYAILGLILTAVLVPFSGLIVMIFFEGNYKQFFATLGKTPGFCISLIIITLLGPLGSIPRCISLAYSTVKMVYPNLSPLLFNAMACGLIFICTYKKKRIMDILGYVLTPLLLGSLFYIIMKGMLTATPLPISSTKEPLSLFLHGLKEGYNTMDLLAAFFFSTMIVKSLKTVLNKHPEASLKKIAFIAILVGASLLALTYIGFSYIAAYHTHDLSVISVDKLLGAIILKMMGSSAGIFICLTVALTCLTTAIALCNVFAEYVRNELFDQKIEYHSALIGTLLLTFIISNMEFQGISSYLGPVLEIIYPILIALTIYQILVATFAHKKTPLSL